MTQWSHISINIKNVITIRNNNKIPLKIHFFNWAIYHQKYETVFWKQIAQILGIWLVEMSISTNQKPEIWVSRFQNRVLWPCGYQYPRKKREMSKWNLHYIKS